MNRIPHISPLAIEHLLDRPVAFHRAFVGITGSVDAALFLSQAVYWSKRTRGADGWFYKSREEWHEETGLSRFEQESSRKKLRALGILHELRKGIPAQLYYRVDFERLAQLLSEYAQREADKSRENPASGPKNDQRDEENARSEAKTVTPTTMLVSDQHDGQFSTNKMASFSPPKLTETTTETTYREEEDNQVKLIVKARDDFSTSPEHDASVERTHPSKAKSSKTKTVKSLSESEQPAPSQQTDSRPLEISPAARRDISDFKPPPPPSLDNHTAPPAASDFRRVPASHSGHSVEPLQPPVNPPDSKWGFRRNLELEETVYRMLGTELTIELRAIQRICKRHGEAWYGWLRNHLMPQLERIGAEHTPQAVRAAVRAFHGGTDPARYGLADFVKALEQYQPPKRSKTHAERVDDVVNSILEEIERERALNTERR